MGGNWQPSAALLDGRHCPGLHAPLPTGGFWAKKCPHCGGAFEQPGDLWAHLAWECHSEEDADTPAIADSQHLAGEAALAGPNVPALWYRGLIPHHWTYGRETPQDTPYQCQASHPQTELPFKVPVGALVATDGSGGKHTSDSRLRRCSWSVVVVSRQGELLFWVMGKLHGKQTVPASELWALAQALLFTTQGEHAVVDCLPVVKGFQKGPNHPHKVDPTLWVELWKAAEQT